MGLTPSIYTEPSLTCDAGDAAVASPHASAPAPPSNGDASHLRNGTASVRHPSHGLPLPVHHPRAGGAAVLAELRFSLLEILAQAQLTRVGVRCGRQGGERGACCQCDCVGLCVPCSASLGLQNA